MNLLEVSQFLNCEMAAIDQEKATQITILGVGALDKAGPDQVTFFHNAKYYQQAIDSAAAAIITAEALPFNGKKKPICLLAKNPYAAWARLVQKFYPPIHSFSGVAEQAKICPTATLGENVTVYPNAFIDANAVIGSGTVIYPGVFIGTKVVIGENCIIYPNVSIMQETEIGHAVTIHAGSVIGADGFGFAPEGMQNLKIPQIGKVVIGDHVEIGANVCIDRAAVGITRIEDQVKLDNLVQIGHGVTVGKSALIAAQFGAAGGAKLGERFISGGQSSISGHVEVPPFVTLGGKSAITRTPLKGTTVMGVPAIAAHDWRRLQVYLKKLPELFRDVKTHIKLIKG